MLTARKDYIKRLISTPIAAHFLPLLQIRPLATKPLSEPSFVVIIFGVQFPYQLPGRSSTTDSASAELNGTSWNPPASQPRQFSKRPVKQLSRVARRSMIMTGSHYQSALNYVRYTSPNGFPSRPSRRTPNLEYAWMQGKRHASLGLVDRKQGAGMVLRNFRPAFQRSMVSAVCVEALLRRYRQRCHGWPGIKTFIEQLTLWKTGIKPYLWLLRTIM